MIKLGESLILYQYSRRQVKCLQPRAHRRHVARCARARGVCAVDACTHAVTVRVESEVANVTVRECGCAWACARSKAFDSPTSITSLVATARAHQRTHERVSHTRQPGIVKYGWRARWPHHVLASGDTRINNCTETSGDASPGCRQLRVFGDRSWFSTRTAVSLGAIELRPVEKRLNSDA